MGQEIVYCFKCLTRVTGAELEKGKAVRSGARVACAKCAPELGIAPAVLDVPPPSTRRIKLSPSSTRISRVDAPAPRRSVLPWVAGGALVLGAVVLLVLLGSVGGSPRPSPTASEPPPPPTPSAPVEKPDPRREEARLALERARETADLDARIKAFEEALRKAERTDLLPDVRRGHDEALALRKSVLERAVRDALAKDDLSTARAALAAQAGSRELEGEIRAKADRLLSRVLEELRRPGADPAALRARVAAWGYDELLRAFDASYVPPPPPSPAVLEYRSRWGAAAALAAARDFDGARAELKRAASGAAEDVRREAESDLKDVEALSALYAAFTSSAGGLAGRSLRVAELEGPLAFSNASRARIGDAFVEWMDLPATALAALLRESRGEPGADERKALALLALLEGDADGARGILRGPDALLPEKAWTYAKSAKRPGPSPREREARALFYAAEGAFDDVETRAGAVEKYAALLAGFADTRLVAADGGRIRERSEAGRDYVFGPLDLEGSPGFQRGSAPKAEACWTAREDRSGPAVLEAYVEASFFGRADVEYKAWAYAGACCAETFEAYAQASELQEPKKKTPCEPGGPAALPLKASLPNLRPRHATHATKGEPKAPTRWDWIPLPPLKFSAAGVKRLRVLSPQKGFSVAAVVVGAGRSAPLPEAELKELLARGVTRLEGPLDGLLGGWSLDGHGAGTPGPSMSARRPPAWVAGARGQALRFGPEQELNGAGFDFNGNAITVAAWVRHDEFTGKIQRYVTVGSEVAVLRAESAAGQLHWYLRLDGELKHLYADNVLRAGVWTHVAGTWDGTTMRVWRDGQPVGELRPGGRMKDAANQLHFAMSTEPLLGALDDVRVYGRALAAEEIRALAGADAAAAATPAPSPVSSDRPWRPLFDGRTTAKLLAPEAWKVENGALVPAAYPFKPAHVEETIGDAELRVRVSFELMSYFAISARHTGEGANYGEWTRPDLDALRGAPRDFVMRLQGDVVTLTVDGRPWPVKARGKPTRGYLHISGVGQGVKIHAIEIRDPEPAWKPIFDGRGLDFMSASDHRSWRVENGGIVPVPGQSGNDRHAAQSRESFGDGELRVRFEVNGPLRYVFFAIRQGGEGMVRFALDADEIARLAPGVHEVRLGGRGKDLRGFLDGRPHPVDVGSSPARGRVMFNCQGDGLRILSLDWRTSTD